MRQALSRTIPVLISVVVAALLIIPSAWILPRVVASSQAGPEPGASRPIRASKSSGSQGAASRTAPPARLTTASAPIGPVYPPPGGVTMTPAPANGDSVGRAGGRTLSFTALEMNRFSALYWGPRDVASVQLAFDGAIDGAGETLTFDSANSQLPLGVAYWTGTATLLFADNHTEALPTRFTLRTFQADGTTPASMVAASSVGVGNGSAVLPVTGDFKANLLFEAQRLGAWSPAIALYDGLPTPAGPAPYGNAPGTTGPVMSSFDGAFFYTAPDIAVGKTVDHATPRVSQNVTYTVTAGNVGSGAATGVVVTDLLPAGLSFVSATVSQGAYAGGTGVWTVGRVESGGSATLVLIARVETLSPITNTATRTGGDQIDPVSSNDTASVRIDPVPNTHYIYLPLIRRD